MTEYTLEQIRSVFGDGAMTAVGQDRRLAAFDKAIASVKADAVKEFARENYRVSMDCPNHCDDATAGLSHHWVAAIEKGAGDE